MKKNILTEVHLEEALSIWIVTCGGLETDVSFHDKNDMNERLVMINYYYTNLETAVFTWNFDSVWTRMEQLRAFWCQPPIQADFFPLIAL